VSFEVFMNGLRDLPLREIERIYKGMKTNWAEVGSSSGTIQVFDLPDNHSARALYLSVIFAGAKPRTFEGAARLETEQQMIEAVSVSSSAMAYASSTQTNPKVRGLGLRVNGNRVLYPTPQSVLNLEYPLTRTISAAAVAEPSAGAKDFLNFIVSPLGEDLLREAKFVPLINY
jgi:phosphate transport system substrate-binding protein